MLAQEAVRGEGEHGDFSPVAQELLVEKWTMRLGKSFAQAPLKNPDAFLSALEGYSSQLVNQMFDRMAADRGYALAGGYEGEDEYEEQDLVGDF